MREALMTSAVWVLLSIGFGGLVWHWFGAERAMEFYTGYIIEYSLSVDNLFVFVVIFSYFSVPAVLQHRVLFWGIIGALVMRGAMILALTGLISRYHWVLYIFGGVLLYTGLRLLLHRDADLNLEENRILRFCRKHFRITNEYHKDRFLVRTAAGLALTPLGVVLIIVESSDLLFAIDSIPAIFAVTSDPFIVYTSNVCAILGLRSLYFLLSGIITYFRYLKVGLSLVLMFIGAKMLAAYWYKIPVQISLLVIAALLGLSILASLLYPDAKKADAASRDEKH